MQPQCHGSKTRCRMQDVQRWASSMDLSQVSTEGHQQVLPALPELLPDSQQGQHTQQHEPEQVDFRLGASVGWALQDPFVHTCLLDISHTPEISPSGMLQAGTNNSILAGDAGSVNLSRVEVRQTESHVGAVAAVSAGNRSSWLLKCSFACRSPMLKS